MADLMRKVSPGDALDLPAAVYNDLLDMLRWWRKARLGPAGGGAPGVQVDPSVEVLVKNTTGGALAERSILSPSASSIVVSPVDEPAYVAARPAMSGVAPASTSSPVLILSESIASDGIGRAVVGGLAVCDVNVTSGSHIWARATASNTARLESATSGPALILWREPGSSGLKRAVVALNNGGVPGGTTSPPGPPGPPGPPAPPAAAGARVARVTGNSGTPAAHTGERQNSTSGTLADDGTSLTAIYLSDGSAVPTNGYLALTLMSSGEYVGVPAQPASNSQPGWVTTGQQTIAGDKDFAAKVTAAKFIGGAGGIVYTPDVTFPVVLDQTIVRNTLECHSTVVANAAGIVHYTGFRVQNSSGTLKIGVTQSAGPGSTLEIVGGIIVGVT